MISGDPERSRFQEIGADCPAEGSTSACRYLRSARLGGINPNHALNALMSQEEFSLMPTAVTRHALLIVVASAIATMPASSQSPSNGDPVYWITRNRIGLLKYCQSKGYLDAATVSRATDRVKKVLVLFPAPADAGIGDAAEKAGEEGKWGQMRTSVENYAKLSGVTPAAACKEWSE
jgi:hypothetical protein